MVGLGSSTNRADIYELLNCFKGVLFLILQPFRLLSREWNHEVSYIRTVG